MSYLVYTICKLLSIREQYRWLHQFHQIMANHSKGWDAKPRPKAQAMVDGLPEVDYFVYRFLEVCMVFQKKYTPIGVVRSRESRKLL
ncbi:hypothetical protein QFZ77_002408 [Paenibacillus sp. V4I3]|nr:hypothetical protein [Paenibacillus sp. V4I3]